MQLVHIFSNIIDINNINTKFNNIKATHLYHLCAACPSLTVGPVHPGEAISQGGTKMLKRNDVDSEELVQMIKGGSGSKLIWN